jgi:hypothetical protein
MDFFLHIYVLKESHSMHIRNGPTYEKKQGALNGETSHNEEH